MKNMQILQSVDKTEVGFAYSAFGDIFDPIRLLAEWYNWWSQGHTAPGDMPNDIHTRTAIILAQRTKEEK